MAVQRNVVKKKLKVAQMEVGLSNFVQNCYDPDSIVSNCRGKVKLCRVSYLKTLLGFRIVPAFLHTAQTFDIRNVFAVVKC